VQYSIPADATWEPDLWGRVRLSVESAARSAQISAADLANVRLSEQALLATEYFLLAAEDMQQGVLADAIAAYTQNLKLTNDRFAAGVASRSDITLAQTQLAAAQAQSTDVRALRAQYEHAIAVLIGQPPSALSITPIVLGAPPPPIPAVPAAVPSELLERRPDVAASERGVAVANANIGLAMTAYYPTLTLTANPGLVAFQLAKLLRWPPPGRSLPPRCLRPAWPQADAPARPTARSASSDQKFRYEPSRPRARITAMNLTPHPPPADTDDDTRADLGAPTLIHLEEPSALKSRPTHGADLGSNSRVPLWPILSTICCLGGCDHRPSAPARPAILMHDGAPRLPVAGREIVTLLLKPMALRLSVVRETVSLIAAIHLAASMAGHQQEDVFRLNPHLRRVPHHLAQANARKFWPRINQGIPAMPQRKARFSCPGRQFMGRLRGAPRIFGTSSRPQRPFSSGFSFARLQQRSVVGLSLVWLVTALAEWMR